MKKYTVEFGIRGTDQVKTWKGKAQDFTHAIISGLRKLNLKASDTFIKSLGSEL